MDSRVEIPFELPAARTTARRHLTALLAAAWCVGLIGRAAEPADPSQVEALQRQLRELQQEFERQQALQRAQIEALQKQIEALRTPQATNLVATPPSVPSNATTVTSPIPAPAPSSAGSGADSTRAPWSPADPLRVAGGGRSYLNLSLDGLFAVGTSTADDLEALELGGHDPQVRGFTLQNLEMTLDGAVDPYFRGQANLVFQVDSSGESRFELEEAYLTTIALPGNLQGKAGQFYTEFGRLNPTHPHTWWFADTPLPNARYFGPDGLRNPGVRLSWLVPTPFYSELFLAVQNSQGETAYSFRQDNEGEPMFGRPLDPGEVHSLGDMLFAPRYAASIDLTDTQTLLVGGSAAFGPNASGTDTDTRIYGADLFWKWKPVNHHGGFPFVAWQTEFLLRQYEAGAYDGLADPTNPTTPLPRETLEDYGFYSQLTYGFSRGWVAGFRFDYAASNPSLYEALLGRDPTRDLRWRASPNLTYYPSEFSKLRLQYNYDDRHTLGVDHSIWFQFEFLLGAHAAHKF